MTLEEAKKIVRNMDAFLNDAHEPNKINIDGEMSKEELYALWVVIDALGVDFSLRDE